MNHPVSIHASVVPEGPEERKAGASHLMSSGPWRSSPKAYANWAFFVVCMEGMPGVDGLVDISEKPGVSGR